MSSHWKGNNKFYIEFSENCFNRGDVIWNYTSRFKVIRTYRMTWWKKILIKLGFKFEISKKVKVKYI